MDVKTYDLWKKIKSIARNGSGIYHCTDMDDKRRVYELIHAGYITVSWKTSLDAAFHIAAEID
ncbi:MAG: hypothetical protein K2G55_00220 [Lachnospiraceae bacterium]|nr:hypothetical protein [Lachnospiraceae bacterium]MDE7201509.1 hypothetical protein [Lachnospiraceae bacterium]